MDEKSHICVQVQKERALPLIIAHVSPEFTPTVQLRFHFISYQIHDGEFKKKQKISSG